MTENQNLKEGLIKNSFWNFISLIINRVGSLILVIILTRVLMPEGYGLYSIVLSIAMVFFTFSHLGIDETLVRYLSLALKKDKKKVYAYYKYLVKIKFFLVSTAFISFFFLSYPLAFYVFRNSQLLLPFLIAAFYVFVLSFDTFYTQIFYAIEKVQYISFKESLTQILKIILVIFIFYFIASSYYITSIFFSFALVSFFMIFFSFFYLKKLFLRFYIKSKVKINKKKIKKFIGFLTIASISTAFFSYIDAIMLGIFLSPEYVGYYRAAFSLVFGIAGILSFPNFVLLPFFTELGNKKTKKVLKNVFKYLSIVTIPAVLGLIVLGKYFIRIFYGYSYLPAVLPLYFLSILILPGVLIGLFLSFFSAKGKPEVFAKLIMITCLINIFLNLFFIKLFLLISPSWAMAGAAIATLLSWFIYFFALIYAIKKEFNFSISFKPLIKPLIAGAIMFGVLFYSLKLIENITLIFGILEVLLGVSIYFFIMILIKGIEKKDLELIKILFKRNKG